MAKNYNREGKKLWKENQSEFYRSQKLIIILMAAN